MNADAQVANVEITQYKKWHPVIDRFIPVVEAELWYPPYEDADIAEDKVKHVEIALMHTRAADSIRVSYDLHRDGWVIEQASRFVWAPGDEEMDEDWQEVAYVPAWGREESKEESIKRLGFDPNPGDQ